MKYNGDVTRKFRAGYRQRAGAAQFLRNVTKEDIVRELVHEDAGFPIADAYGTVKHNDPSRGNHISERLGKTAYRLRHPRKMKEALTTGDAYGQAWELYAFGPQNQRMSAQEAVEQAYLGLAKKLGPLKDRKRGPKTVNKVLDEVKRGNIPEGIAREALIEYFSGEIQGANEYLKSGGVMPFRVPAIRARGRFVRKLSALQSDGPLEAVRYKAA